MIQNKPKPWELRKKASYRIGKFEQNEKILIVCEGQTEALYFKGFEVYGLQVKSVDSGGRTKRQLVEYCDRYIQNLAKEDNDFKEIWCVFDMDIQQGEKEFADFDMAIASAMSKKYNVAYSNDAFELWFYLHYSYNDQQNRRDFYYAHLSRVWGFNYQRIGKTKEECQKNYNRLLTHDKSSQENAISNAKRLHNIFKHLTYSQQNPVTTVYLLVETLNKYLKGSRRS